MDFSYLNHLKMIELTEFQLFLDHFWLLAFVALKLYTKFRHIPNIARVSILDLHRVKIEANSDDTGIRCVRQAFAGIRQIQDFRIFGKGLSGVTDRT